ncbi:Alpha/Beta hydrolase protein [Pisolithus marmoratus]|nr:Alpha/Beta hydrolase protein [Pisolithus marmoratus]
MIAEPYPAIVVPAVEKHTATIIFVHGLGDSGHGWKAAAETLGKNPSLQHVKWVLPHAHSRPVTVSNGKQVPAWFDICLHALNGSEEQHEHVKITPSGDLQKIACNGFEDREGILQAVQILNDIIKQEIESGLGADRIVLGGFSQGGALSLLTGLTAEHKLGGVIALSALLHLQKELKDMIAQHARSLPIFWAQGDVDSLVPTKLVDQSVNLLTSLGISLLRQEEFGKPGITFVAYAGLGHSSCQDELRDMGQFMSRVIPVDVV